MPAVAGPLVIGHLRDLDVPKPLRPAHDRIVRAAEQEIVFYGDFTAARVNGKPADLGRMPGHPAAREASYELHTAWGLIRRSYPNVSPAQLQPLEEHLCQFDVQ